MHSLCPTREWEREWYGVTTPNIISGQGVVLFPFGATPPLIGEAEEVVAAEPMGAFNRDPNDLVLTMGCSVLGRGAEPPQFWVLLIWLEPGISHVTWVHYDATMCLPCFVCSVLPVLHFLRFDLCVL